ncbi:MAG: hypothetical protein ACI4AH_02040 [Muribaculaceae bacterium]
MNIIPTALLNNTKMLKRLLKYIVIVVATILLACMCIWCYHYCFVDQVHNDFTAKVENVKTMARHNALEIIDETIYTDTINGICEVYSVKARITVQYDLERMRYQFEGDTLVVEVPHEIITAHELDRRLLDEYHADGKLHFTQPSITGKQSNEIEYRMQQFVKTTMVNQDHIKRARRNELANMVRLLKAIHPNVKVVININHPQQSLTPDNLPMPSDV